MKITIKRRTRETDGQGGFVEGYAAIATESGRVRPARGSERTLAGKLTTDVSHIVYLRAGTPVKHGDRLGTTGFDLDVLAVREPGLAGRHVEIDCSQI